MTDSSAAVSASTFVADVLPIVQAVAASAITALVGLGVALIAKYTGLKISQAQAGRIDGYIGELAAQEIARAADNLAHAQIDVGSPIVKGIVDQVAAALPDEMAALGVTPEAVAAKAAAAFGRLQASMTAVPPSPTKAS